MSRTKAIRKLRQVISYDERPSELTRMIHAQALRYIVHPFHHDTNAPSSEYDHVPQVAQYKTAFNNFKSADMFAGGEKLKLLRDVVSFGKGLSNPRLKPHRRKCRANDMMRVTRRLLREFCRENKPLSGLTIFTVPIARTLIRK